MTNSIRSGREVFDEIVLRGQWDFTDDEFERAVLDRQHRYPHSADAMGNVLPIHGSDFSGEIRNMLSALRLQIQALERDLKATGKTPCSTETQTTADTETRYEALVLAIDVLRQGGNFVREMAFKRMPTYVKVRINNIFTARDAIRGEHE